MIREKTIEYFNMLKKDKKDWYTYFITDYRITNLRFLNIYNNIEFPIKEKIKDLTRPLVDSTYQSWNKARVQLKSDLNYLLDHIKLYIDYYEGDNKILFFGGLAVKDFYYIEIPNFYYLGVDITGFFKKYENFNMHLPVLTEIFKIQFKEHDLDELKFIALKIIESSKRNISKFNKGDLPKKSYDLDYLKSKYNLKRKL
jgi:hypothetical protein